MLRLLEAHCVPILSYAIEVLVVAYNAVYRKMFGYSYRESVTLLQHTLNRPTWEELIHKRKADFQIRLRQCPIDSLARLF